MKDVIEDPSIDDKTKETFKEALTIADTHYDTYLNSLKEDLTSHDKYDILETYYKKILAIEKELAPLLENVWNSYLTDPKDYKPGEPFRFLIHSTKSCKSTIKDFDKICCTLVTDKCMPIPYGDIGYVVKFDMDLIDTMSCDDSGSWKIDKDLFVERNFPSTWQLLNPDEEINVFYESETVSKLITPSIMERQMIENNIKYYGEALSSKSTGYSEIFFKSGNRRMENIGFFAKNEDGIKVLEELDSNMPKVLLDINTYRMQAGLEPEGVSERK